ncbi:MAG: hypothetical protein V1792_20610 [Pseudomonadota bacterium]
MVNQMENVFEGCGCEPYPAEAQGVGCQGCSPNMYLTCDEETILAKMRDLKDRVRPISLRMKEVERSSLLGGSGELEYGEEWSGLSEQLESFRTQWGEWEKRLDEAIERKLILLGHREG